VHAATPRILHIDAPGRFFNLPDAMSRAYWVWPGGAESPLRRKTCCRNTVCWRSATADSD